MDTVYTICLVVGFAIPLITLILGGIFDASVDSDADGPDVGAVGCTGSLINLLTNLFVGLSVSTGVLVARYFASKQQQKLTDTIQTSMSISLISGIILAVIGILFARPILVLMNAKEEILDKAVTYITVYFWGSGAPVPEADRIQIL